MNQTILVNKKCLVTGGAGFIGSHLVDQLLSTGAQVRVLDNFATGKKDNLNHNLESNNFELHRGSVTDPFDVQKAMKDIDYVFHLACLGVRHSITHPFNNHRVNSEGTLLLLNAALENKVTRFLYCSSSEVYGSAKFVPMPEHHPTEPCTIYGASKLAGEAYARAYSLTYGLPITIIRPFNTFGPRSHHEKDSGEMIPKSIVRAFSGKNILVFGDGSNTRDFTYVKDTANGLLTAAINTKTIGKTFNIGSNFEISIKSLAEKILILTGKNDVNIDFTKDRPGDVTQLYADSTAFKNLTGWQSQFSFDEGLQKTIEYFQKHPAGIKNLARDETGCNWENN